MPQQIQLPPELLQLTPVGITTAEAELAKVATHKLQQQLDALAFHMDTVRGYLNILVQGIEDQQVHRALGEYNAQRGKEFQLLQLPHEILVNDGNGTTIVRGVIRDVGEKASCGLLVSDGDLKAMHGKEFTADTPGAAVEAARAFIQAEFAKLQEAQVAGG